MGEQGTGQQSDKKIHNNFNYLQYRIDALIAAFSAARQELPLCRLLRLLRGDTTYIKARSPKPFPLQALVRNRPKRLPDPLKPGPIRELAFLIAAGRFGKACLPRSLM